MVALVGGGGVYLTNWALQYLNYTVRVVFKSCKVIPVMLFGTVLQGRVYSGQEYAAGGRSSPSPRHGCSSHCPWTPLALTQITFTQCPQPSCWSSASLCLQLAERAGPKISTLSESSSSAWLSSVMP